MNIPFISVILSIVIRIAIAIWLALALIGGNVVAILLLCYPLDNAQVDFEGSAFWVLVGAIILTLIQLAILNSYTENDVKRKVDSIVNH